VHNFWLVNIEQHEQFSKHIPVKGCKFVRQDLVFNMHVFFDLADIARDCVGGFAGLPDFLLKKTASFYFFCLHAR
jgi:hypothetical protein